MDGFIEKLTFEQRTQGCEEVSRVKKTAGRGGKVARLWAEGFVGILVEQHRDRYDWDRVSTGDEVKASGGVLWRASDCGRDFGFFFFSWVRWKSIGHFLAAVLHNLVSALKGLFL